MKDLIAARRQQIKDAAPCVGCGATLASCKANRGKDPTAPPWFGCCARGSDMAPCRHVPSASALFALLDEVEAGSVRTVEEATPKPREKGMSWLDYLDQGERWQPNGRPMVAIGDMDPEWRYNASRWLERNAAKIAGRHVLDELLWFEARIASSTGPSEHSADAILRGVKDLADGCLADPHTWIRTTALYRALVADLPDCSLALSAIADRAKHWSTCPARTESGECRCEQIAAQCEPCRDGGNCQICSGTSCGSCPDCAPQVPEWTIG